MHPASPASRLQSADVHFLAYHLFPCPFIKDAPQHLTSPLTNTRKKKPTQETLHLLRGPSSSETSTYALMPNYLIIAYLAAIVKKKIQKR
jgi:hypothetical protein